MQFLLLVLISFVVFCAILIFFIKHQQRVPYYQIDTQTCVNILKLAVEGGLLEKDWHVFIGMSVRYDDEIETLRAACLEIDEAYVINTRISDGKVYVVFSKQGILCLQALLDEWQHKVNYLA